MSHQPIQNTVALFRGHRQNTRSISLNNLVEKILSASAIAIMSRGELSYLPPLGSENIAAPYFKQCFMTGVRDF
jgi:hypothetical protein